MKPHQRRAEAAYPYYKLATWDERSCTFRDGRVAFATEDGARRSITRTGKYRLSRVTKDGRTDLEVFEVRN